MARTGDRRWPMMRGRQNERSFYICQFAGLRMEAGRSLAPGAGVLPDCDSHEPCGRDMRQISIPGSAIALVTLCACVAAGCSREGPPQNAPAPGTAGAAASAATIAVNGKV